MRFAAIGDDRGRSRSPARPSCGTWWCWSSFYGVGEALFQPAFTAIVPDVVPREELLQANALKELMEPLGLRFAGPALGGVLIAVFGVGTAFLVDAATFAVSALAVIVHGAAAAAARGARLDRGATSREGFAYVRAHAWLWAHARRRRAVPARHLRPVRGAAAVHHPQRPRRRRRHVRAPCSPPAALGSIAAALVLEPHRGAAPARDVHVARLGRRATALDVGLAVAGAAWQMCADRVRRLRALHRRAWSSGTR